MRLANPWQIPYFLNYVSETIVTLFVNGFKLLAQLLELSGVCIRRFGESMSFESESPMAFMFSYLCLQTETRPINAPTKPVMMVMRPPNIFNHDSTVSRLSRFSLRITARSSTI